MIEWITVFCIIAAIFAIATLIYVAISIAHAITKKNEARREHARFVRETHRTEGLVLLTGLFCAATGYLIGRSFMKEKDSAKGFPFER